MVLLKSFRNIFSIADLRSKLLFTLGVLFVYRIGYMIPVMGVDVSKLGEFMKQASKLGAFFNYLDSLSGSNYANCTLFSLGISPYITASIVMQLLGMTIPSLEQLSKEGEFGRKVLNQYTRYLTLVLSVVYSFSYASLLQAQGLALEPGIAFKLMFVTSLTAGCMFVMWLGDQISLFGIGNGASMIIFAGIVAQFPTYATKLWQYINLGTLDPLTAAIIVGILLVIIACIVFLEKGERKIPVQYARRVIGNRVFSGQTSFIPFKINPVGVMPVIFANAALQLPIMITNLLVWQFPSLSFLSNVFSYNSVLFVVLDFVLIIFFTFLYTALYMNPEELAQNIKKNGGFIPGIRPGKQTAQFFDYVLNRIGLVGAIYLAILAVIPSLMAMTITMPFYLGGTSLLIVVGVALETAAQMESYLIEHRYEGFLAEGSFKSRIAR